MSRLNGRKPVEVNINSPKQDHVPVYNETTRLWETVTRLSGSAQTSGSNTFAGNQTISGSLLVTNGITGSLYGTASHALSGNGAFIGSFSGSLANLQGTVSHIPYFSASQVLADSTIFQVDNGPGQGFSIAINQNGVTTAAPEALYVYQESTSSYNVISGKGNLNNYLQLNIQNTNQGGNASSDVVATANNGNESSNYIDMGINSVNFSGSVGLANDAYVYSTGRHLHIGNVSNYPVQIFAGGSDTDANKKLELNPNNLHELTGSLDISGSLTVRNGITGSLQGSSSYAATASYANNFIVAGTLTAQTIVAQTITSSVVYASGSNIFGNNLSNVHQFTGSVNVTGSISLNGSALIPSNQTSSLSVATASYAAYAVTASYILNAVSASYVLSSSYARSASYATNATSASYSLSASYVQTSQTASYVLSSSYAISSSYSINSTSASYASSASYVKNAQTASYINPLVQAVIITGSLNVSGSTTQVGNTTLLGNTTISGSLTVSGSIPGAATNINIYGDTTLNGAIKFLPVVENIDNSISASYIFVSGSTQDLYFSQNGRGYINTTRLRWLEGNLYTGLLNGAIISASAPTVYTVSSGSGIIVNLNGSYIDSPYPTIDYINWPNLSASIAPLSASYDQTFIGIYASGSNKIPKLITQGTPFNDGQFDTLIPIGLVLHQNNSTINGAKTQPSLAYGFKQRSNVFVQAFGPLKLSGFPMATSSSLGVTVGSGTAFADGANYSIDPNNPSYITDAGTAVSKIYRYWQSGSADWRYDTNGGVGYTTIDPGHYVSGSVLVDISGLSGGSRRFTIQRAFWFPNSNTKAIVVYYGNALYTTLTDAITNIQIESFIEAPNTAANGIFLGSIIVRNDAVFTTAASYQLVPAGLFRSVGGQAGGGGTVVTSTLAGLSDVAISGQTNGQALVWNNVSNRWVNSSTLTATLTGNASTATTASYAVTASYTITAASASYLINGATASYAITASYVNGIVANAATASYVLNAISSSYAATASYANNFTVAGTLTAQTLVVQTITASQEYSSGSNIFGNSLSNTQQFTGSVAITGSLSVNGTIINNLTSSNTVSASYALTSSYATTASYIIGGGSSANGFPYSGSAVITGSLIISSSTATSPLALKGTGSGVFTVDGTTGRLFQIDDSLSGSLFSVNTISGLPVMEAFSDNTVRIGKFGSKALYVSQSAIGIGKETSLNGILDVSGSMYVTGSLSILGSITGSITSASYATTASYWSGTVTSAATASYASTFTIGVSQISTATVASSIVGSNNLFTTATGSFTSAFYKYTATNGANARAGEVMAIWNAGTTQYTDYSTIDIGTTSNVTASVSIVTSQVQFNVITGTSGWSIKSQVTYI